MKIIKGGVTAPKGFLACGIAAGIKKSGRKDLALLYSEVPAMAAAAFTTNRFQASPVKVSRVNLKNKTHQAIIVNSGNANCANGSTGDRDASLMVHFAAREMALKDKEVLVASTGIIGRYLDMGKIKRNIPDLAGELNPAGGTSFADAIMTTDTARKELALKVNIGGAAVTIGGSCKGVGMIYPALALEKHATMLCFITTDASIAKNMLQRALREAIDGSFNMISVDGDMSTNDSCFILANGLAGNKKIAKAGKSYKLFLGALGFLTKELSKRIVEDGEGATKLVEIEVSGAKTLDDAKKIARKISTSNLLKCAINGADPNWGRIASSAGSCGVRFDPDKADIYLGPIKVLSNGSSVKDCDMKKARKLFQAKAVHIRVDLKEGSSRATAWTCDLSKKYVEINAEYST